MKGDDMLMLGAIAAGAYLIYRVSKPLEQTVAGIGGGVSEAVGGAGESVSSTLRGVSSPFRVAGAWGDAAASRIYVYGEAEQKGIRAAQPEITGRITSEERGKRLRADTTTSRIDRGFALQDYQTTATKGALLRNLPEETQRQTEYGSTSGQFFKKTFMPTREVAQERREAAKIKISSAGSAIKSAAVKTVNVIKGIGSSISKKLKR